MKERVSVGRVFASFVCNFMLATGVLLWLADFVHRACSACTAPQRALIGIAGATCIVFARPALTAGRRNPRRSFHDREPALDAMFVGRLMGLALGVMTHLWLSMRFN